MPAVAAASSEVLDPDLFLAIEDLELAARGIVEGAWQGLRRSPWRGSGVEFETHRDYRPGDDPRHVNWPLYAMHKKLFVKEFRAETNLPLYLMLDASGSMAVANGPSQKFAYAARAAAALAYLAQCDRDSAGLVILKSSVEEGLAARSGQTHFLEMLAMLQRAVPSGAGDLSEGLNQARELCRRRGMVVLLSDLFDKEEAVIHNLCCLREQGHDVVVFQVLDPLESALPVDGDLEFEDAETGERLRTSVGSIREAYQRAVDEWRGKFRADCEQAGLDWVTATTSDPLADVVSNFLIRRMERRS